MIYPGPASIDPGLAPGGLVFRVYNMAGTELLERRVPASTTEDEIDNAAEADADLAVQLSKGDLCLVTYDGDTGQRISPVSPEDLGFKP